MANLHITGKFIWYIDFNEGGIMNRTGGRKFTALLAGLIAPLWLAIVWSYIIRDWTFAITFAGLVLGGIVSYITGNVVQKGIEKRGK